MQRIDFVKKSGSMDRTLLDVSPLLVFFITPVKQVRFSSVFRDQGVTTMCRFVEKFIGR
jgi:hypothetical protein